MTQHERAELADRLDEMEDREPDRMRAAALRAAAAELRAMVAARSPIGYLWRFKSDDAVWKFTDTEPVGALSGDMQVETRALYEVPPDLLVEARDALGQMIHETTHQSSLDADGSYECRISGEALAKARAVYTHLEEKL
jgi:hypothetical protein